MTVYLFARGIHLFIELLQQSFPCIQQGIIGLANDFAHALLLQFSHLRFHHYQPLLYSNQLPRERLDLFDVHGWLWEEGLKRVLLEAGPTLLGSHLEEGFVAGTPKL